MNCLGNLAKEKQKNCKMCEVFDKKKQEEITGESAEEEKQIVNHRDKLCRKKEELYNV